MVGEEVQIVVVSESVITETWVKPLTRNDELMIELLTKRYEGVDAAFVKFEDPTSVTLRIPKIRLNVEKLYGLEVPTSSESVSQGRD